jgi:hypothetical protein
VRKSERLIQANLRRNGVVDERVERRRADDREHGLSLGMVRADVTVGEPGRHLNVGLRAA